MGLVWLNILDLILGLYDLSMSFRLDRCFPLIDSKLLATLILRSSDLYPVLKGILPKKVNLLCSSFSYLISSNENTAILLLLKLNLIANLYF